VRGVRLPHGLKLVVLSGPDRGRELTLAVGTYLVGKGSSCDLVLSDPAVSRQHLEVALLVDCVQVRDLGSTNGSHYQGARFDSIRVGVGAVIRIGGSDLSVRGPTLGAHVPAGARHFGGVVATSDRMGAVFDLLERIAPSDATVLLHGETGTGKELVTEAIHAASPRRDGPLVVCDLGAMARGVFESELFGHLRGAFTGADQAREGAFADAHGGTILLDEVGEMSLDAQPVLLRALEARAIRPVGSTTYRPVDVRVVAATHRDLAAEVRAGRFREDLYHRLRVVQVELPPLRERPEDIPVLVEWLLGALSEEIGSAPSRLSEAALAALIAHDWPGNVRELRNVLERALSISPNPGAIDPALLGLDPPAVDERPEPILPFREAKDRLVQSWERDYLTMILDRAGGNVSLAAREAGLDRPYLHRLLRKHGLGR